MIKRSLEKKKLNINFFRVKSTEICSKKIGNDKFGKNVIHE